MFSIKNREDLENLNELVSLKNQVKASNLQDELGKKIHDDMKKVFEPDTERIKDVSQDVRKAITVTLEENDKVLANLNDKRLEKMKERGILASYLLSPLSKTTNPEHTFQYTLPEDPESCRVSDVLINKTFPVTLYDNLLTFRDTNKKSEL